MRAWARYLRALSTREVKAHAEGLATSTRFCKTKLELITSALSLCTNHALEAQLPDALVRRHAARLGLVVRGAEDAAGDTGALRVQLQEHWASVRVQDALLYVLPLGRVSARAPPPPPLTP